MERKLLVIDTDDDMLENLKKFFTKRGYRVLVESSKEDGFRAIEKHTPHIVITEARLPATSNSEIAFGGLSLLCAIRRDPKLHELPVILVSNLSSQNDILCAFERGATAYMPKPLDFRELKEAVDLVFQDIMRATPVTSLSLER